MITLFLVGLLAVIAVPMVARQNDRARGEQLARRVSMILQEAKARALARGAAVVVRFDGPNGALHVLEASSADPDALVPSASCSLPATRWTDPALHREVDQLVLSPSSGLVWHVEQVSSDGAAVARDKVEICFTPGAAMLVRVATGVFSSDVQAMMVHVVQRDANGEPVGLKRTVFVLPSGTTRVATSGGA